VTLLVAMALAAEPVVLPPGHTLLGFGADGTRWVRTPNGIGPEGGDTWAPASGKTLADGAGPVARIHQGVLYTQDEAGAWSGHTIAHPTGVARAPEGAFWVWSGDQVFHVTERGAVPRAAPCAVDSIGGTRGDEVLVHCGRNDGYQSHWVGLASSRPFEGGRVVLSPDGRLGLRGRKEGAWVELDTGVETPIPARGQVAWDRDGSRAVVWESQQAWVWDRPTDQWTEIAMDRPYGDVRFSFDGTELLAGHESTIDRYDTATGAFLTPTPGHRRRMRLVAVSPAEDAVLTVDDSGERWFWHAGEEPVRLSPWPEQEWVRRPRGYTADTQHGRFTPDGQTVISAAESGHVDLRDGRTGKLREVLSIDIPVEELGTHLALDVAAGPMNLRCGTGPREIEFPSLSEDGSVVATVGNVTRLTETARHPRHLRREPLVQMWSVPSGKLLRRITSDHQVELHGFDEQGRLRVRAGNAHLLIGTRGDPEIVDASDWPPVSREEDLEWVSSGSWNLDSSPRAWAGFRKHQGTIVFRSTAP